MGDKSNYLLKQVFLKFNRFGREIKVCSIRNAADLKKVIDIYLWVTVIYKKDNKDFDFHDVISQGLHKYVFLAILLAITFDLIYIVHPGHNNNKKIVCTSLFSSSNEASKNKKK